MWMVVLISKLIGESVRLSILFKIRMAWRLELSSMKVMQCDCVSLC